MFESSSIPIRAETTFGANSFVPAEEIKIAGLTPFTSIDYPGKLSAVAFLQGCPWQCVYCHNTWMQSREFHPDYRHSSWEELARLLSRRRGLLDAVVFSGGEPCLDPALGDAMRRVKDEFGMAVGLHTSGAYPRRLAEVIDLVDWVGLDVKANPENAVAFDEVTGRKGSAEAFKESFDIVRRSGKAYEARTTAHPDYLPEEELLALTAWLAERGASTYALQIYRTPPQATPRFARVGSDYPSQATLDALRARFPHFTVRREGE